MNKNIFLKKLNQLAVVGAILICCFLFLFLVLIGLEMVVGILPIPFIGN